MRVIKNRRIDDSIVKERYQYYKEEKCPVCLMLSLMLTIVIMPILLIFTYESGKKVQDISIFIFMLFMELILIIIAIGCIVINIKAAIWTRRYKKMKRHQ